MSRRTLLAAILACLAFFPSAARPADANKPLWEIGTSDNRNAEFALAPNQYSAYKEDGFFVIGQSDAKRDWPYVQPGPADGWASSRPHTATILFGLKAAPPEGACQLLLDLIDTQGQVPPELRITVNNQSFQRRLPPGGGDASVNGDAAKGREHRLALEFPAGLLRVGANEISITTLSGSWMLYDALSLQAPAGTELAPITGTAVHTVTAPPVLVERGGRLFQTIEVSLRHFGEPADAVVRIPGAAPVSIRLKPGAQRVEAPVPAVEKETVVDVSVEVAGKAIAGRKQVLKPVRQWTVYLLPHSHVDIGYTQLQTTVLKDHWRYIEQAIEASKKTANYPPESRYKWNVEVLWAVDGYLRQASPEKQREFIEAVRSGAIGLDALYGNELTGLCRPEELLRLQRYATILGEKCGVAVDSAMISDVPGYTWGIVPALAHAGVKYLSSGPNGGDRIGFTLAAWEDKPFYWVSPSGQEKILCWIPYRGYFRSFDPRGQWMGILTDLEKKNYPFDMVQLRYCLGDNHGPDTTLSDSVRDWNATHAYPKLVIATTSAMFKEFEKRYGDKLPIARGDFTPYWEDGAASSARETALARDAAERLVQAEALWTMLKPAPFPAERFLTAWHNVILYDEHTWGAFNSISEPDAKFVRDQWTIKQAFAVDADAQSRALLAGALAGRSARESVDVFNTTSWVRTGLVLAPKSLSSAGDRVTDSAGTILPSQRLSTGELAFVARDVPPFAAQRYTISAGSAEAKGSARAEAAALSTAGLALRVDPLTGAIVSLRADGVSADLAARSPVALNDYRYVPGKDPRSAKPNGATRIRVKEAGPLVATLRIEADAPGCRSLVREVRVADGLDTVELLNIVDKQPVRTKEGVHFGFSFNVPGGVMRMDIPWAVARPEQDQIPGACKNWFTVQRWVDISNDQYGVTWTTVDAPMVEVGAITAELPWMEHIQPSQTLYSYVMNNYWHTNYKADQEGPTTFRYALRPHRGYQAEAAARFGIAASQPLMVAPAAGEAPAGSRLSVDAAGVVVTALKPSDDGKATIVRLYAASGKAETATLRWAEPRPASLWLSDTSELPRKPISGPITLPPYGIVTVRAEH